VPKEIYNTIEIYFLKRNIVFEQMQLLSAYPFSYILTALVYFLAILDLIV